MKASLYTTLGLTLAFAASTAFAAEDTPPPPPPAEAGKHISMGDTNKDGVISKEEWRARGDQMFNAADANKDGNLSADEMKAMHEKKRAGFKGRKGPQSDDGETPPPPPAE